MPRQIRWAVGIKQIAGHPACGGNRAERFGQRAIRRDAPGGNLREEPVQRLMEIGNLDLLARIAARWNQAVRALRLGHSSNHGDWLPNAQGFTCGTPERDVHGR